MSTKAKQEKSEQISLHDAFLMIVATAVAMRDETGLSVRMANGKTGFALIVDGWHYVDGRAVRVVANVVANPEVGGQ